MIDRVFRWDLPPDPERAAMMSLDYIQRLIRQGRTDPVVQQRAAQIRAAAGVAPGDAPGTIAAVHRWVQANIRYVRDSELARAYGLEESTELLTGARWLIALADRGQGEGDCDDQVILECSLLEALGVRCRVAIIKADARWPHEWSHIYLHAWDGTRWVSLDPIMRDKPIGWEPPKFYERRVLDIGRGAAFPGLGAEEGTMPFMTRGQLIAPTGERGGPWHREIPSATRSLDRVGLSMNGMGAIPSHSYPDDNVIPYYRPTVGVDPMPSRVPGYWAGMGYTASTMFGQVAKTEPAPAPAAAPAEDAWLKTLQALTGAGQNVFTQWTKYQTERDRIKAGLPPAEVLQVQMPGMQAAAPGAVPTWAWVVGGVAVVGLGALFLMGGRRRR